MSSDRVLKLFIVLTVLAAAWYAGREAASGLAIPVAIVGLAATYWRAVLGIPVAVAMVAAAVYVPGVAIAATFLVAFLAMISAFVNSALRRASLKLDPVRRSTVTPGDGNIYFGPAGSFDSVGLDGGGGCDGGGFDAGF